MTELEPEDPEQAGTVTKTKFCRHFLRAETALQQGHAVAHPLLHQPLSGRAFKRPLETPFEGPRCQS